MSVNKYKEYFSSILNGNMNTPYYDIINISTTKGDAKQNNPVT